MPKITLDKFAGLAPKFGNKNLPIGFAKVATDIRIDANRLKAAKAPRVDQAIRDNVKSMFFWKKQFWLTSTDDVDFVQSPVINDVHSRIYWAGGDWPAYSAADIATSGWVADTDSADLPVLPASYYRLGVSPPDTVPVVTVGGTATDPDEDPLSSSYVYTLVTAYGEESAPSDPSELFEWRSGNTVSVYIPTPTQANVNFGAGAKKRVYRVATGSTTSEYLFVGEVLMTTNTFSDTVPDAELGEPISTIGHYPPPNDDVGAYPDGALKSLLTHPQGFLLGHSGRTISFSEPYLPHAWNPENYLRTEFEIVGMAVSASGVVVTTTKAPYLLTGSSPESMDLYPLESDQACVSRRSMVDIGGACFYASPDGIVVVNGNTVQLATKDLFTREQWQQYEPSTIHAYSYEGRYIGFYGTDPDTGGFVFEPSTGLFYDITQYADTGHVSESDNSLYLKSGTSIVEYDAGPLETYYWETGDIRLHDGIVFGWARVEASEDTTITIKVDGEVHYSKTVGDEEPFPIPSGLRGRVMNIGLAGSGEIDSVTLADSIMEIEP